MTNKHQARRQILKTLASGASVVAGAYSLPGEWKKPAVHLAFLPVHAQLSCQSLSIDGITIFCNVAPPDNELWYQVDDRDGCPVLVTSTTEPEMNEYIQVSTAFDPGFFVSVSIRLGSSLGGTTFQHSLQNCGGDPSVSGPTGDLVRSFEALSGAPWNASYTVSGDASGLSIGPILLSPAL